MAQGEFELPLVQGRVAVKSIVSYRSIKCRKVKQVA